MQSVLELEVRRRSLADRYARLYRSADLSPTARLARLQDVKQLLCATGVTAAPFDADAPELYPLPSAMDGRRVPFPA